MSEAQRYSTGAIVLHWLIALALAGEIALGFAMPKDASGFTLYQLHKSIGITILLLSAIRLSWRLTHARPAPIEGGVTGALASAVHVGFYVFMIAMPITGWAMVSTDPLDIPTILFGVVPWPHLPLAEGLNAIFMEAHEWLAWGGLALFALHVAGALRHHFLIGDGLLSRMSPHGDALTLAGLAAVLALGVGTLALLGGPAEHDHADHDHGADAHSAEEGSAQSGAGAAASQDGHDHEHAPGEEHGDAEAENAEDADTPEEETDAEAPEPAASATPTPTPTPTQAAGPPPDWTIQPAGTLRFSVDNAGSRLNGSFARWSGDIVMDPDNPSTAEIAIRVELASATLGDATQDRMVRGGDFLAASANPTATWRSTSVRRVSGNRYEADGTLSLKGTSRSQRITFTLSGSGNRRAVQGSASIDRNAFNVGTGDNAANLAPSVSVSFTFDAAR